MEKFNLKSAYSELDHITNKVEEWSDKMDEFAANDFFTPTSDFYEVVTKAQQALTMAAEDLQDAAVRMEQRIDEIEQEKINTGQTDEGSTMKLVYKETGEEVKVGDVVTTRDDTKVEVTFYRPPHKPGSSGKVCVKYVDEEWAQEFFVGVIGAEWIGREEPGGDRYEGSAS